MIREIIYGAQCAFAGFTLIRRPGIKRFVIIPLSINIGLFTLAIWYTLGLVGTGVNALVEWLPSWLDWLSWLIWPLFVVLVLIVIFYTFTLVANLIGGPFNGFLAEKLETNLTGVTPPSSGRVVESLLAVKNAILSEIIKFGYLISRVIPLFILGFIPGLNVFAPLLWFLFGAWMLALEYMDYPMGNHGMTFREERQKLSAHRGLMLGFGGVVMAMTLIPVLNFFAMPVAVAGATQLWVKHIKPKSES